MPVSKVMDLPGPVVCLMWGCVYLVLSGRCTRWAWAFLSLHTDCTFSVCTEALLIAAPNLLATQQPWPLPESNTSCRSREEERTCLCQSYTLSLDCKKATAGGQGHSIATPKVEQLFFHRVDKWNVEPTLSCSCGPLTEVFVFRFYALWIGTNRDTACTILCKQAAAC